MTRLSEERLRDFAAHSEFSGVRSMASEFSGVRSMAVELLELRAFRDAVLAWDESGNDPAGAFLRLHDAITAERARLGRGQP